MFRGMLENRKGESSAPIAWTFIFFMALIPLIIVLAFVTLFTIGTFQGNVTEQPLALQADSLAERFFSSSECFAYEDPFTGEFVKNSIDLEKFTAEQFERCYFTGEGGFEDVNFAIVLPAYEGVGLTSDNYYNVYGTIFEQLVLVYEEREEGQEGERRRPVLSQIEIHVQGEV